MASITFPYATFEQASADNFAKIDGKAEAYRLMSNGFKQEYWRKGANEKRQDRVKKAMALLKKHEEAQGGTKAERQLGR